jgi:hypothetical protein
VLISKFDKTAPETRNKRFAPPKNLEVVNLGGAAAVEGFYHHAQGEGESEAVCAASASAALARDNIS